MAGGTWRRATVVVLGVLLAGCSSDAPADPGPDEADVVPTTPAELGTCSGFESPTASSYAIDDIDGDGVALRFFPRIDSDVVVVLADGIEVDARLDVGGCAVTDDDIIWWEVGSDEVGGGWVDSRFLEPLRAE